MGTANVSSIQKTNAAEAAQEEKSWEGLENVIDDVIAEADAELAQEMKAKSAVSKSTSLSKKTNPRFDDPALAKRVKGYNRDIARLEKQLSRHKLQTDAMANRQVMFSNLQPR